jgi:hypothetical protein
MNTRGERKSPKTQYGRIETVISEIIAKGPISVSGREKLLMTLL